MINVSEVIRDPDFCTSFRIVRQIGYFTGGNFIVESTEQKDVLGVVDPAPGKTLEVSAESDRATNMKNFYCLEELKISPDGSISDFVIYGDKTYKIFKVENFSDFGYFLGSGVEV